MAEGRKTHSTLDIQDFSFFQHCPDYVVVVDTEWSIIYGNPSFQERFSPGPPVRGKKFFDYLDMPSGARIRELQFESLEAGRNIDLNHLTADGGTATLHYCFFRLSQPGSSAPLWGGVGRDRAGDLATLLEIIQLNLELERKQKELSEANARLEVLAITDQITQLYNRHYFFQVAQHSWEQARRYKLPLTVMLIDLDEFKTINDTHGHLFGDHVLAQTCSRLKANTRKSDILARYGGEEIVLLAPNTDLQTGLVLADRLRAAVGCEPFTMGNCSATVTVSVGVSGTELQEFSSFDQLLDSSDQAMYTAKRAGKNRVSQYRPADAPRV